jgi:hypothetical protein
MVLFSFAGHDVTPLPEGALFWPSRRALLVADLHLEKASFFARLGQMLPPYDSIATLAALTALADATDAAEIWCLGDSFHDRHGCERLSARARDMLRALTGRLRWTWITGNHDPILGDTCGGDLATEAQVEGIMLRHAADPGDARPEISGHWHPRLRISVRGRRVSRRCFLAAPNRMVLPAFGSLTGGMDAADPAIVRAVGAPLQALVPMRDRLLRFPLAA